MIVAMNKKDGLNEFFRSLMLKVLASVTSTAIVWLMRSIAKLL